MGENNNNAAQQQDVNQIIKNKREKLANLQAEGRDPFIITKYDQTYHSDRAVAEYLALEEKLLAGKEELEYDDKRAIMDASPIEVSIAGRIMLKRVMGKASFCNVSDLKGNIQVYVSRDSLGEEAYGYFKKYDVGDIIGAKGYMFRTQKGEISVHATETTLLSKNLQPLPEKYHGLTNTDLRYRQRYTDLIMNPEVKDTFVKRSKIISTIRRFLDGQGFMEVETPMLVANAGGAAARPFQTHFNALDEDLNLRISLELYLKRLIVGGLERVYEIGRVFRNEGLDTRHNPEFTLMELYQAYTDYYGMMDLTENMFRHVAQEVLGTTKFSYGDVELDFGKPFERLTMVEAVKKYAGVDFDEIADDEAAKAIAKEKGVEFEPHHTVGNILNLFFEEFVEDHLLQPTFVMDHPIEISPLTKKKPDKEGYVERFELFINGWEMCNAYSELNDPIDQRERFKAQDALADMGDEEANHTDEDFLNALEIGMAPTGGIGYGIDRLCMLLTDSPAIRDVLFFPTMKSLSGAAKKEDSQEKVKETKTVAEPKDTRECSESITVKDTITATAMENGDYTTTPTREAAYALLTKYNKEAFHVQHALTVEGVMRYYAAQNACDPDFWGMVGLLHDVDFELYSEEHCKKAPELLKEIGCSEEMIRAIVSHGYGLCSDVEPLHIMEKTLYAVDELTGLIWACALMRPSKSTKDLELKSLKKKFKDKRFAAGCSRDVIEKGAAMLGIELEQLLESGILAMRECEDSVAKAMEAL